MNRHDMDWDELGAVWRATTLDKETLALQLDKRLKRQALYRRLEILAEIAGTILAVIAGILLWWNMADEPVWKRIAVDATLLIFLASSWAISLWIRRGTGGEAQTLTAMIDLAIARAESSRRRVTGFALAGVFAFLWALIFWLLHPVAQDLPAEAARRRALSGLAFLIFWVGVWCGGMVSWAWWKWRREQKYLAQFREIKRMLEDGT